MLGVLEASCCMMRACPLVVIDKVRSWCRVAEIEEWTIKCGGCINADYSRRIYGSGAKCLLAATYDEAEDSNKIYTVCHR